MMTWPYSLIARYTKGTRGSAKMRPVWNGLLKESLLLPDLDVDTKEIQCTSVTSVSSCFILPTIES